MAVEATRARIQPSGREFIVERNDTLLEAALRAGLSLSYGCSNGNCGQCKARLLSGELRKARHYDYVLSEAEKSAGAFLMCCNAAVTDLVVEAHESFGAADMPLQNIAARVRAVSLLSEDMRLLHLQTPRSNRLRFLAGQSVSLTLADGTTTSCPVASCPCDDRNLEFHIERRPGAAFSEAVFNRLKIMDTVRVEGPRGQFVLDEESRRPLLFIACGSGFAPVKSLIEHAIAIDAGSLALCWMASGKTGHYLNNLCRSWADALDAFRYTPMTVDSLSPAAVQDALARTLEDRFDLAQFDVYVAGPDALVPGAERSLVERGAEPAHLYACRLPAPG
ncbi:MAG: 2Fe-2S iron-sulfur cluster-binding protein [Casimicrobiaceae bacterium]